MNLAEFSRELNRMADALQREIPRNKFSPFVIRARNLAKEAEQVYLEDLIAL